MSRVVSRGFLLGAAEWLAVIPVGMIFSGRAVTETVSSQPSGAEVVGATVAAGLVSFITGGVAVVMAFTCLLGFAVAYFMGREMQPKELLPLASVRNARSSSKQKRASAGTAEPLWDVHRNERLAGRTRSARRVNTV